MWQGGAEGKLSELPALLERLGLAAAGARNAVQNGEPGEDRKDSYPFWETQPVPQYNEEQLSSSVRSRLQLDAFETFEVLQHPCEGGQNVSLQSVPHPLLLHTWVSKCWLLVATL